MKIETAVSREEFAAAYLDAVGSSQNAKDDGRLISDRFVGTAYGIYEKLIEGSKKANLTAILSPDGVAQRHILDSLIPYLFLEKREIIKDGVRIADVGCGAGFPTLPTVCCRASAPVISEPVVSIHPGEMLLTRAFPARLTASACVSAAIPPFAAV